MDSKYGPIEYCSSYQELVHIPYWDLENIINQVFEINPDDKKLIHVVLSEMIRSVFKGNLQQVKDNYSNVLDGNVDIKSGSGGYATINKCQFLSELTYHLFGSEVLRNPSCLIINQMMLDLVEELGDDYKQFHFGKFFTNKEYSASIKGALKGSRHNINKSTLPLNYNLYGPKDENKGKKIRCKEAAIVRDWCKMKMVQEGGNPNEVMDDDLILLYLEQNLSEKIQEWYNGVDLSHFYEHKPSKIVEPYLSCRLVDNTIKSEPEAESDTGVGR